MTSPTIKPDWQPYREPLRVTLFRTVTIALLVGALLARRMPGGGLGGGMAGGSGWIARWPIATLLALWPSFGGHWVELWLLNWLRPRLSPARAVLVGMRIAVWFVGGILLAAGMHLTAMGLDIRPARWEPMGWFVMIGGVGFIGIELIVHLVLQLRGRPSFYNGRG